MMMMTTIMMENLVMKQNVVMIVRTYRNLISGIDFPVNDEDEQDANNENDSSSNRDESEELFTGSEED